MTVQFYTNVPVSVTKESTIEKGIVRLEAIRLDEKESMSFRIRAFIMIAIIDKIRKKRITQKKAAEICKITQPGISNLLSGKVEHFSMDRLVRIAGRLNLNVSLSAEEMLAPK